MTTEAGLPAAAHALPAWSSVLAVVAHPDDESFGLGAVLDAFARSGATVSVLCFTRGEASSLPSVSGDLDLLRAAELQSAAAALGLDSAILSDHPDGALAGVDQGALVAEVSAAIGRAHPVGLVVFDPSGVTGHPDHVAASAAALRAAAMSDLPVLGWTLPREVAERLNEEFGTGFVGHQPSQIDLTVTVDRDRQRMASLAHASQAVPTSALWRRLELLGDQEVAWNCQNHRQEVVEAAVASLRPVVGTLIARAEQAGSSHTQVTAPIHLRGVRDVQLGSR